MPYICYVDEAGCATPLPSANTNIQPALVICGLIIDNLQVAGLTTDFLRLKRKYFPGKFKSPHQLDDVREEIKGSDIRSRIRKRTRRAKAELKFLDDVLALLKTRGALIFATIWIKGICKPFRPRAIYTRSIQHACHTFQDLLTKKDDVGFIVADFRTTQLNDQVAHSIFTQKYKATGDPFDRLLELPTFGVSFNHVGLQITDLLCSALLFPMATATYCKGHVRGIHVHANDLFIKRRYMTRIKALQHRSVISGKMVGGIWVWDSHAHRSSALLFAVPNVQPAVSPTVPLVAVSKPGSAQ